MFYRRKLFPSRGSAPLGAHSSCSPRRWALAALAVVGLAACAGEPTSTAVDGAGLEGPGHYCFESTGETVSGTVRLTVAADGRVSGESAATIHDDDAGYYTSYRQALTGEHSGERLDLEVVTWIEDDRQVAQETWTIQGGRLDTGSTVFEEIDCGTGGGAAGGDGTS